MKITTRAAFLALAGMQALLALTMLWEFIAGNAYFAYVDIGSDTYAMIVPHAMHMARALARGDISGWSFGLGLGAQTTWTMGDGLGVIGQLAGPENVLPLRISVYLLKIFLGGAAFFALVRLWVARQETALIAALAYSFCGYVVINGQWDPHATEFVYFPLILWAIVRQLRGGSPVVLPLVVAAALACDVFFTAVGAFLVMTCIAFAATSENPRAMLRCWLTQVLPLAATGFLLAAPHLLPVIVQLMDSPRVSGDQSLISQLLRQSLVVNDWPVLLAQIGGLFHKDIFGIGSFHKGHGNYFEGPEFYIGVTLLLVIPQMWGGTRADRKTLLVALGALAVYFVFPFLRYAAFGFAAPYFRVSSLWVSLVLLLLATRAVDLVIAQAVQGRLLAVGAAIYGLLLAVVTGAGLQGSVSMPQAARMAAVGLMACGLLAACWRKLVPARWVPLVLLVAVAVETLVIAGPSYTEDRVPVAPEHNRYNDATLQALAAIRAMDKGVFRIEKTYDSVFLADALAQDYMGIKSYYFQSGSVVRFNSALGLISTPPDVPTNWIFNVNSRFFLNSLLGVKYIIAREPVRWPGFVAVASGSGWQVWRNDMALPLGVVQTRQVTQADWARLATLPESQRNSARDAVIFQSVVVDRPFALLGAPIAPEEILNSRPASLQNLYFAPATVLQKTGLRVQTFASDRVTGVIQPDKAGMLVFSIPFNRGWSLKLNGTEAALVEANFGMLATPVQAGIHTVDLEFRVPGRRAGMLLGLAGIALLALWRLRLSGRSRRAAVPLPSPDKT